MYGYYGPYIAPPKIVIMGGANGLFQKAKMGSTICRRLRRGKHNFVSGDITDCISIRFVFHNSLYLMTDCIYIS